MRKIPYITLLTALALLFRLYTAHSPNPVLPLIWAAGLALLLAGELLGIRLGKGARFASNIGAAVSSALILTVSIIRLIIVMQSYPADYLVTMWSSIYDITGFIAVASLLINLGSAAAKRVLIWREHHGALPDKGLTLRAFRAHFIVAAALNVIYVAAYYVTIIFFPDMIFSGVMWFPLGAINIAIAAETANMIGIFFDRLLEKRVINNILIAARGTADIIAYAGYLSREQLIADAYSRSFNRFMIAAWTAVIAAAAVCAAIKLRKTAKSRLYDE